MPPAGVDREVVPEAVPSGLDHGWKRTWFLTGLGLAPAVYIFLLVVGGPARDVALAGLPIVLLLILALLAQAGVRYLWARVLAVVWLAVVTGSAALLALGYSALALQPALPGSWTLDALVRLLLIVAGTGFGIFLGWLCYLPPLRRALARALPIDPGSFVHATALVAVVSLTLVSFVPLLILGEPPLLVVLAREPADASSGQLVESIYALVWVLPAAVLAVGYPLVRSFSATLERLGLVRPTRRQVTLALALAIGLVGAVTGIESLWEAVGWPATDPASLEKLFAYANSPLGALVIGVTAGLGEELGVRGVLQPRLGLWLSNLLFTSLHAFQYGFDGLLIVFFLGLVLGLVRQRTNTSTSAIVHGTYNFVSVLMSDLEVPGVS